MYILNIDFRFCFLNVDLLFIGMLVRFYWLLIDYRSLIKETHVLSATVGSGFFQFISPPTVLNVAFQKWIFGIHSLCFTRTYLELMVPNKQLVHHLIQLYKLDVFVFEPRNIRNHGTLLRKYCSLISAIIVSSYDVGINYIK